jgi:hypothetical protein
VALADEPALLGRAVLDDGVEDRLVVGFGAAVGPDPDGTGDGRALRHGVDQRLAVGSDRGGEPDHPAQAVGDFLGHPRDHDPAHRVPDQHDVVQVLEPQDGLDVGHERLEADVVAGEVGSLAEPGQRRGVDVVAPVPQQPGHRLPAPPAVAAAVHQHERGRVADRLSLRHCTLLLGNDDVRVSDC